MGRGGSQRSTELPGSDPQLADLRAFAAVHETGSFSRAARLLGISQPSVSIRLQNLEEHLGFKLLDRRPGAALTEMGRPIYGRAKQILAQVDAFGAAARGLESLQAGYLRVGFSTPPQAMALVGQFRRANPGVRMGLSQSNTWSLLDALKKAEVDIAIMTMSGPPSEQFSSVLLEHQRLAAMVPVGHRLDRQGKVTLRQLFEEPILLRGAPSMTFTQVEREAAQQGLALDPFLELPSREAIREAVASGLGVGLAFASEIGLDHRIAVCEIEDAEEANSVYVVGPADLGGVPAIAAFMEIARANVAKNVLDAAAAQPRGS